MNKTVITIVIAAAVLAGGYLLFFRGAPQPTPPVLQTSNQQTPSQPPLGQTPAAGKNIITYTDTGYSPTILKIKNGETVIFKNNSSQSMWTASGVHPTHRLYPTTGGCIGSTFDACQGIQPGQSWSFKFDIAGTWKYHNHLNPSDTGTVVVE